MEKVENKYNIEVIEIDREDLKKYEHVSKKEGISFAKNSTYYGYYINGKMFGFGALLFAGQSCTFKTNYVFPPFRKKGLYGKAFVINKQIAFSKGIKYLYGNCTKMSIGTHIRLGAKVIEVFKNGITRVRYENI